MRHGWHSFLFVLVAVLFMTSGPLAMAADDAAGTWAIEVMADGETHQAQLVIKVEEGKWSGTVRARDREMPLKDLAVENGTMKFLVETDRMKVTFDLKVGSDKLEGTFKTDDASGPVKGSRV
ncbi:MAG: hypothetical protein JNL98_38245 [Bryobacterales bacterium]|nr:hypothetical protein [Bryobacterales bacterium]